MWLRNKDTACDCTVSGQWNPFPDFFFKSVSAKPQQLKTMKGNVDLGGTRSHCVQLSLINPILPALWVPCHDLIFSLIFSFWGILAKLRSLLVLFTCSFVTLDWWSLSFSVSVALSPCWNASKGVPLELQLGKALMPKWRTRIGPKDHLWKPITKQRVHLHAVRRLCMCASHKQIFAGSAEYMLPLWPR